MHPQWDGAGSGLSQAVPSLVPRADVQIGMSGQETPSESSDADSSEGDTTGDDEDVWDSGESSVSLVAKRQPLTHSIRRTTHNQTLNQHHHNRQHQEHQRHESCFGECIEGSIS